MLILFNGRVPILMFSRTEVMITSVGATLKRLLTLATVKSSPSIDAILSKSN